MWIAAALVAAFILAGAESHADIYRYRDGNGAECFTDTPSTRNATRIVKEPPKARRPAPTGNLPHPVASTSQGQHEATATGTFETGHEAAMPLPVRGVVTSTVGLRHDPIDGQLRHHNGVDIAVPEGTPVKPVAPGVVTFSGFRGGYGNMVIVAHDDGMVTIYAHNSVNLAAAGERVTSGATIALSGSTGRSTGPHLHFEAWKNGQNLTSTFIGGMPESGITSARLHPQNIIIRRVLQTDGTILFTNLP